MISDESFIIFWQFIDAKAHVSKIVLLFFKRILTLSLKSKMSNLSGINFKSCSIFGENVRADLNLKRCYMIFMELYERIKIAVFKRVGYPRREFHAKNITLL